MITVPEHGEDKNIHPEEISSMILIYTTEPAETYLETKLVIQTCHDGAHDMPKTRISSVDTRKA